MKVATIVLGALSIASTKASLFNEFEDDQDFSLQEDWEDIEGDRFLRSLAEGEPDILIEGPTDTEDDDNEERRWKPSRRNNDDERRPSRRNNDDEEWRPRRRNNDDEDDSRRGGRRNNRRRGGRKGKGGRRGKGRGWKKGGRKGKKGKKNGPFDIEKLFARIEKKSDNQEKKLEGKCEKKLARQNKMCGFVEDSENCGQWALAKQVKCNAYGLNRITSKEITGKCMGEYKHMMASFIKDEIKPRMDIAAVSNCFGDSLAKAKTAFEAAEVAYNKAMQGVTEIPEEDLAQARKALKAERKNSRKSNKRGGRRGQKGSWRRKNNKKGDWRRKNKPTKKPSNKPQFQDESYDEENETNPKWRN